MLFECFCCSYILYHLWVALANYQILAYYKGLDK